MYAASLRDITTATAQRHGMTAVGLHVRPGAADRAVDAILERHLGPESLRHLRAFGMTVVMFGMGEANDALVIIRGLAAVLEARPDVWVGAHLHDPKTRDDIQVRSRPYDLCVLETAMTRFDPLERLEAA